MALDEMPPRRWWEFLVARLTPTTIGVIKLCRNGDDMGAEALHAMAMNARLSNFSNIIIADVVASGLVRYARNLCLTPKAH